MSTLRCISVLVQFCVSFARYTFKHAHFTQGYQGCIAAL